MRVTEYHSCLGLCQVARTVGFNKHRYLAVHAYMYWFQARCYVCYIAPGDRNVIHGSAMVEISLYHPELPEP
jgi:hypothetical protein